MAQEDFYAGRVALAILWTAGGRQVIGTVAGHGMAAMTEPRSSDLQTVSVGTLCPPPVALAQSLFPRRLHLLGNLRSGLVWPSGGNAPFLEPGAFQSESAFIQC
jgi:hypothetical protein